MSPCLYISFTDTNKSDLWQCNEQAFVHIALEYFSNIVGFRVKHNFHHCCHSSARTDKNEDAFLPPLQFGEKRYFGQVWPFLESEKTKLLNFIRQLIWSGVAEYIPSSPLEGVFDVPQVVSGTSL